MSRFGSTAQFKWNTGDTFTGANTVDLDEQDMPQYPMEEGRESDAERYVTKSGREYLTKNYDKRILFFNWTDLSETKRGELRTMADGYPLFNFNSGGTNWGTYRMAPDSWEDSEALFELFEVSFEAVEDI